MGSFKLRLVIYFMLLALLPLVAATVAFSEVAQRGETGSADARLSTAIRVAQADYEEQIAEDAAETAKSLARATQVQQALQDHNRAKLLQFTKDVPNSSFYSAANELLAGQKPPPLAPFRVVRVTADGKLVGKVMVTVPFDDALVRRLSIRSALDDGDRFVFVADGKVIAPSRIEGKLEVPHQGPSYISVGGSTYRAVGTDLLAAEPSLDRPAISMVALSPKPAIDQAVQDLRSRFLLFSAVAMLAVGILAYTFGRTIVRSLGELAAAAAGIAKGRLEQRVPVRGRDEFAALGEAFNDMAAQLEQRLARARSRARPRPGRDRAVRRRPCGDA